MFFVHLKPAENNKEIHNINALQNKIILFELLRVNKNNITHRMRCQKMMTQNHTVTNHSYALNVIDFMTVKTAKKNKETPTKCRNNHPATRRCAKYMLN